MAPQLGMLQLTSTLNEEGKTSDSVCMGEIVTYTCKVTDSPNYYLEWALKPSHYCEGHLIMFTHWDSVGSTKTEESGLFNATLVGKNEGGWDLISQISIRIDDSLQNKSIQCSDGLLHAHEALPHIGMILCMCL